MIHRHWLVALLLAPLTAHAEPRGETEWLPLWNGSNLDGWTTWLQQPHRNSVVPGMSRDAEKNSGSVSIKLNRPNLFPRLNIPQLLPKNIKNQWLGQKTIHA